MTGPVLFSVEVNTVCSMRCPFCYAAARRWSPGAWRLDVLDRFLREAAEVVGGDFVVVYGDGEPLLTPRLTGAALRAALVAGASYTGFTTSGLHPEKLPLVEEGYGGRLGGDVVVTVSIDTYKVLAGRRGEGLSAAWRRAREALAGNMWGLPVPEEPPASLETLEWLSSREARVSLNLLATRDAPRLLPLVEALVEEGLVEQVNVLAPKPLEPFLPVPAPLHRLLYGLERLCRRGRCRVAVDTSVEILLGVVRVCPVAGRRLYSVGVDGVVKPCSFAAREEGLLWRPGWLGVILTALRRRRVEGCPYLRSNAYRREPRVLVR